MATTYRYEALNDEGIRISGTIDADSPGQAEEMLLGKGVFATGIRPASWGLRLPALFRHPVPPREIILFSKQFKTLVASGVALTQILEILQNQAESRGLRDALSDIRRRITEGEPLHGAFEKHTDIFPPLYCAMLRAGEASGALVEILDRLSSVLSHEEKIRNDIAAAMRYPKMVTISIAAAFLVLLNFVIPQFASIFKAAKIDLPMPTQIAIMLNEALTNWWPVVVPAAVAAWVLARRWLRTDPGRAFRDRLLLRLPIIGPVIQKSILARFAAIFSILQKSGVAMLDALDILSETLGNRAVSRDFDTVKEKMEAGQGLAGPLSEVKCFTPLAVNMVRIGEDSGSLDRMLDELARHYDEEVEFAVGRLTEAIGPLLLVLLGVVVLFFALAVFLPMWDMGKLAM